MFAQKHNLLSNWITKLSKFIETILLVLQENKNLTVCPNSVPHTMHGSGLVRAGPAWPCVPLGGIHRWHCEPRAHSSADLLSGLFFCIGALQVQDADCEAGVGLVMVTGLSLKGLNVCLLLGWVHTVQGKAFYLLINQVQCCPTVWPEGWVLGQTHPKSNSNASIW